MVFNIEGAVAVIAGCFLYIFCGVVVNEVEKVKRDVAEF